MLQGLAVLPQDNASVGEGLGVAPFVIKVLLVVAVLAGGIWLGLRIWRRRQSAD